MFNSDNTTSYHLKKQTYLSSSLNHKNFIDGNISNSSCFRSLSLILNKRNLCINLEGKLYKILPHDQYKINLLKICGLIMIGFLAHIIRRFPYHHTTIIGNSVYSRVAASTLETCKIPFSLCRGNNRFSYYELENGREIPFEGPSSKTFFETLNSMENSDMIQITPLSLEEIVKVEEHTGLRNLETIQKAILSQFINKDNFYLADLNNIISGVTPTHNPVIAIKKFFGNLYYIMTTDETWLTSVIITDTVKPLQSGDIISTLYGEITDISPELNKHGNGHIKLVRKNAYSVGLNLGITELIQNEYDRESIIYSLKEPRPLMDNSIYVIHPFHLPGTGDPFLTIMIVTRALFNIKEKKGSFCTE